MKRKCLLLFTAFVLALTPIGVSAADEELVNVIIHQEALASSEAGEGFEAKMANDGVNDNASYTQWKSSGEDALPWWQADLGVAYKISRIEMESGVGESAETRQNFRILGANQADFSDAVVLVGESAADYGEKLSAQITAQERVRYLKVEKTQRGALSIGEIRAWVRTDDILQGAQTESPRDSMMTDDSSEGRYDIPVDVVGTAYEEKVRLLCSLNIMRGYPDGSFLPGATITRAEFVNVATKLLGYGLSAEKVSFADVPATHWAYQAVETAAGAGMVDGVGGGYFLPDAEISAPQAVKIIVSLLGYGETAESLGGYPGGYLTAAGRIGLFKGLSISGSERITRGEVAVLVCNALDCDMMVQTVFGGGYEAIAYEGDTLLNKNLKLAKAKGIVTGVRGTSLTNANTQKNGRYIEIDGAAFVSDIPNLPSYLGFSVEYYYDIEDDGEETEIAAMIPLKGNDVLEIEAEELISLNGSQLVYGLDKEEKASLSATMDVIYNGVALRNYSSGDLLPEEGSVRLIDNDGDSVYDVFVVSNVVNYVVNWVNAEKELVYAKNFPGALDLSTRDNLVTIQRKAGGSAAALSDIEEWNVLSVMESRNENGKKSYTVILCDDFAEGTIEEMEEEAVVIDGNRYKISGGFDLSEVEVGDSGKFYFDAEDKIAAFDGINTQNGVYGFLKAVNEEKGVDDTLQFRIFTTAGEWVTLDASEKLKVDELTFPDNASLIAHLKLSGRESDKVYQPVRYAANSKGEVMKIDTLFRSSAEGEDSFTKDYESELRYYKSTSIIGMTFAHDNNTAMIRIPDDLSKEEDYEIITSASLGHNKQYTMEAYDGGEDKVMKFLLFTGSLSGSGGSAYSLFLVDKVVRGINDEGEERMKLYGLYDGGETVLTEYESGVIAPGSLKRGDIIGVELSGSGEVRSYSIKFYRGDKPADAAANAISENQPQYGAPYSDIYYAYGKVMTKTDGIINVQFTTDTPYASMLVNADAAELDVYYYDSENDRVIMGNSSYIQDAKTVGEENASYVMFRINAGDAQELIIFG